MAFALGLCIIAIHALDLGLSRRHLKAFEIGPTLSRYKRTLTRDLAFTFRNIDMVAAAKSHTDTHSTHVGIGVGRAFAVAPLVHLCRR